MIKSIAIQLNFDELCKLTNYAEILAESGIEASDEDKTVLETCKKIKQLILANYSTEFILMDKPF